MPMRRPRVAGDAAYIFAHILRRMISAEGLEQMHGPARDALWRKAAMGYIFILLIAISRIASGDAYSHYMKR